MKATDQGTREPGRQRYTVIPRTLVFVTSRNPHTGDRDVLLLRGAPDKRLWPNLYNGLGGHVEQGEGVSAAAEREVQEEAGLAIDNLELRGVISIDTGEDEMGARPGVMVFVFHAESRKRVIIATDEGAPEWIAVDSVADYPLVDDLYEIIPRTLAEGPLFYASYRPHEDGQLGYRFV